MVIFGGFAFGERTNDIYMFSFQNNKWSKINESTSTKPCPRAGHSAVVRNTKEGDFMYIFGGKDDENNKLSDIWKFDFKKNCWTEIN